MSWKKLLESASESLNDHLRLRNDYLMAENRILRNQIDGRVQLTDSERKELAEIGAKLGKQTLQEIATVAQPDTILAWHRKLVDKPVDTSDRPKSVGRPRVDPEIEKWVIRMARENRSWGDDRIHGALNHLGYTISDQTVGNLLKRHGIPPAPERKKTATWGEFVRSHWDMLLATDFFNSEVWSWFGLSILYLLSFIPFSRDRVHALRRMLHRQIQGIRSFVLWALDLSTHLHSWIRLVRLGSQSHAIRCGEGVTRHTASELASPDARPPKAPDRGKVMVSSTVHHGPIRDGPRQRRQRFDRLLKDDGRRAA
jgi:hypothetical protein